MTRLVLCLLLLCSIKLALGCTQFNEGEYSCTWKEASTGEESSITLRISNDFDATRGGWKFTYEECSPTDPDGTPGVVRLNGTEIQFSNDGSSCVSISFMDNNDDFDLIETATIPASCDAFAGNDYTGSGSRVKGYLDCQLGKADAPSESPSSNNSPSSSSNNSSNENSSDSSFLPVSLLCLAVFFIF